MSASRPPKDSLNAPPLPPLPPPPTMLNRLRSHHMIAPLVLYTGACVTGPYPQSVNYLGRAEDVPGGHNVVLPSASAAYSAWLLPPQSPWAGFSKSTLLASLGDAPIVGELPDVMQLDVVKRAELAAMNLAGMGIPRDTLIIVDLRGAAAVAFGTVLTQRANTPLAPVLTFNNWPAPHELVPAEETLSALVTMRPRSINPGDPNELGARPLFLLDAWRLAYRDTQPDDEAFDNRYALTSADLPSAAVLQAQGIRDVIYIIEQRDDESVEEDDLHESFIGYNQSGIGLHLFDLMDFIDPPAPPTGTNMLTIVPGTWLGWRYSHRRYYPRARVTVLASPGFYRRSRGGFGGPHAHPTHFSFGGGFHGGFHGPSHGGG